MYRYHIGRKDTRQLSFYSIIILACFICIFSSPQVVSSQYIGIWPGSTLFGAGSFSYGASGFSSYGSNSSFFSPLSSFSYGGGSNFGSSLTGFGSLWGGTSGFSPFASQTGQGIAQGGLFTSSFNGGYNSTVNALPSFGWGYPMSSGPYQPYGSFGSYGPSVGGIQSNLFSRNLTGNQNLMSTNPASYGTNSWNPVTYQNPLAWVPSYNSVNTYPSGSSSDDTELAEMPPVSQDHGEEYVSDQILVKFHSGVTSDKQKMIHDKHGCKELYTSDYGGFKVIEIPVSSTVEEMVNRYLQETEVEYAEPNYLRHSHLTPNDPYFSYQWHHALMKNTSAWDLGRGTGVTVALLDSGVAYRTASGYTQASDLAGTSLRAGWDFVNADPYPDDDAGHGTHMAGCIAQTTNNYRGVAGVSFGATILAVKVMDETGSISLSDEVDGIYYAVNNGAHVINISFGGEGESASEEAAINYAVNNGVVVICSAGNSGSNILEYPASYPPCISVSAVRYDKTRAGYSNYGTEIDLCAPGGDITVDQNFDYYGDGILQQTHDGSNLSVFYYYFMEGTSPAAALVSGVAALVIGKSSTNLTPQQVEDIMTASATDLGSYGWDSYYGWGLVNSYNALLRTP